MDKTEKLKSLRATYKKLGQEIGALENDPKGIDWTKMPRDTLVKVSTGDNRWRKRYFSHSDYFDGPYFCYTDGKTSTEGRFVMQWSEIRLVKNPDVRFWPGGESSPVPNGIELKLYLRNKTTWSTNKAENLDWIHYKTDAGEEIIGYQILGEG